MADELVHGNYSFKLADLKGSEDLKFFTMEMPSATVEIGTVKHFGEKNGTPVPLSGGGHQTTWKPISMTRYKDASKAMYTWFEQVRKEGATANTKQSPTITCFSGETQLFMWKLTNAVPTSYSQNSANAQTHDLMTETVTLTYEEAVQT